MKIDLSIIIVNWNSKEYLLNCLESIHNYPPPINWEIIIVDNASTDGSPNAVMEIYDSVKMICNPENYGFARANNIGIRLAAGRYIYLVNSDIKVEDGCFNKLFLYMENNPDIGISGPKIRGRDGKVQRSCMEFPTIWNLFCRSIALDILFPHSRLFGAQMMTYWTHDTERDVDVINGCFWIVRREALEDVGFLDEIFFIYAEDIDWCQRFHDAGWRVVFFPSAEAIHYGGTSSKNAPIRFYLEMQKANFQYWRKYHSTLSCFVYLIIRIIHEALRLVGHTAKFTLTLFSNDMPTRKLERSWAGLCWSLRELINQKPINF